MLPLNADVAGGEGLPNLVRGNERFGRRLLETIHRHDPEHNVVVSPVSLALILGAIQNGSWDQQLCKEIGDAFGWGGHPSLGIPARMLLAAFEEPKRGRSAPARTTQSPTRPLVVKVLPNQSFESPEQSWITNTFLFRSKDPRSGGDIKPISPDFVAEASKYFGVTFVNTGAANPTANDVRRARRSAVGLPPVLSTNDVWISSGAHLRTAWEGNTFSLSKPFTSDFWTAGGSKIQVQMIASELSQYPHAVTDSFEAVVLPGNSAYMVVVLPAPGKDIHELERNFADSPEILDTVLKKQNGVITMPTFHFDSSRNLEPHLKEMGIEQVFHDLGPIIRIPKSHLTEVSQRIDIQVDEVGIRASAETVVGAVYGGITGGVTPFQMRIDRPFLFLIRDNNTNTLLFMGAIMDPTQNR
jgi:serine protease inhibitor